MKIQTDTILDCGCCGLPFKVWEGYVSQDQDEGFGICHQCQNPQPQPEYKALQSLTNGDGHGVVAYYLGKFIKTIKGGI